MEYNYTHSLVKIKEGTTTVVASFQSSSDEGAAIMARAIVKRLVKESSDVKETLAKEDFRLVRKQFNRRYK